MELTIGTTRKDGSKTAVTVSSASARYDAPIGPFFVGVDAHNVSMYRNKESLASHSPWLTLARTGRVVALDERYAPLPARAKPKKKAKAATGDKPKAAGATKRKAEGEAGAKKKKRPAKKPKTE